MVDNVVPFDAFENELQISSQQSELPRVVLEGGDDVSLFRRWFFNYLDRLEFVQAANLGVGAGCTAVRAAVESLREAGVRAFGLSDRDRLFKEAEWELLFSVDDTEFTSATEDDDVAINKLWEIEAYLLAPELIPGWVRSHHRDAPASQIEMDVALQRTVEECESLLRAQTWLATAHRSGEKVPDGQYCDRHGDAFAARCAAGLASLNDEHGTAAEIDVHIAKVLEQAPTALPERLGWLLRYVDTKRLMLRLKHRLSLGTARHKWVLAELMDARGLRPQELEARVSDLSARLNS